MSYQPYELQVISHHPQFNGQALKKFNLGGTEHVGAWGDEPFEVQFKNNTSNKVQVRVSIDGTDVLSGGLADTEVIGKMWVVNPYGKLNLKAWPETNKGGARFIFTSAQNGVATHTHGDLSSRGVIAAAVYTETYVAPSTYWTTNRLVDNSGTFYKNGNPYYELANKSFCSNQRLDAGVLRSEVNPASMAYGANENLRRSKSNSEELKSLAAVGAGEQVQQEIQTVSGLVKPALNSVIRVKYLWWNELKSALAENIASLTGQGFPGAVTKMISLGSTPRLETPQNDPVAVATLRSYIENQFNRF